MNIIESVRHRETDNLVRLTCGHTIVTTNPHVRAGSAFECPECPEQRKGLQLPKPEAVLDKLVDDYAATMQAQGHTIGTAERVAIRRAANIQYAWWAAIQRVTTTCK
jgi:uncharacterized protein YbbK (DUF523 family)